MDLSNQMSIKVCDEIPYPFPNFNGTAIEVWEWTSNLIPHFMMDVIPYPCWDYNESMLVKGASAVWCLLKVSSSSFSGGCLSH